MVYLQHWHGWCHMKLLPSRRDLCTSYNHVSCHFMQNHIPKVYACLGATCHLHFWRNDRGLLCATAVTRGWNGYRNKSQHTKLTMEKKILPPLLQGFCRDISIYLSRYYLSVYIYITVCLVICDCFNVTVVSEYTVVTRV